MKNAPAFGISRVTRAALAAASCVAASCALGAPPALTPSGAPNFAGAYAAALQAEALDPVSADPYLALLDAAVARPDAPGALAAAGAAVDALVTGTTLGLDGAGSTAIAYRSRERMGEVVERLRGAWHAAEPQVRGDGSKPGGSSALPFIRGSIAYALHELAMFAGDAAAAEEWGTRRGCAKAATVIGPIDWTPLRGLEGPSPVDPIKPLEASYPGVAPFAATASPIRVRADACQLDVNASSFLQGMRAVVIDVAVPRPQRIHLALTSASAAVVDVGGLRAMRRGFEAGGRPVTRFAVVDVLSAGTVRVVVRVAQRGDGTHVELDALGEDGLPLQTAAPRTGEAADLRAAGAAPVELAKSGAGDDALLAAAGLLAFGEARDAEHLLEARGGGAGAAAIGLDLLYARSLEAAEDMPETKMVERLRVAVDRVLAAWPKAWEARIGHARASERRRGPGDGITEALRELGAQSAGSEAAPGDRMTAAYVALTARRAHLLDVAERAYTELAKDASGSPLLAGVDVRLHDRVGAEAVEAACRGALSRADTTCFEALRERGDYASAIGEIERLRKLRGAPDGMFELELSTRVLAGDLKGALTIYDAMKPSQRRMLDALGLAAGRGDAKSAKPRFLQDRVTARDAPYAIGALVRALGLQPDPAPKLEAAGRKLVLADQAKAFAPGAATAVLQHTERYALEDTGLVHYVTYDLRRVSGTTDVATGGVTYGPAIDGRGATRLLRRRIHKRDGRILEPDAAASSAQQSDLSQLEQGDYVEQIVEGWALPSDTGQIVVDTPDLLPERTSVREATIELRRAASIPLAIWSHPDLGKPADRVEAKANVSVWTLRDRAPRRIEDGVPKMERSVAVSFGTQTWENVARALDENTRSLEERDPYVARWAAGVAGDDKAPTRALVERVVAAVGKKVKVASGGELSDVAAIFGGGAQRTTARTILELGQGTRSWVIYRVLRELGVKADLAIAEPEPFSSSPDFPPHAGRFRHPLVIARLPGGAAAEETIWIDADVEGPPLPPGRVSPELRGRKALLASGALVTVEGAGGELGDEADLRLVLDEKGDARGTFTILLHGRAAQGLAEAFETVVGSDRREMLRSVVLGWVPWADVEEVTVSSGEGSWEVALRAKISVHGYGRPEGKGGKTWVLAGLEPVHIVFPRAAVGTLGATYASRGARQNALSIEMPIQYHLHRRIELPAGAEVTRLPAAVKVEGANLQAIRRTSKSGTAIEDDFTLSLPTGTVAASSYQAFVAHVQTIDDGFMAGTRVKVKP